MEKTDRERSFALSAAIGRRIAEENPVVRYRMEDLAADRASLGREDLAEMAEIGLYDGDFEKFYVIRTFCSETGLSEVADGHYLLKLFQEARRLSADEFLSDPYLSSVKLAGSFHKGNVLLTTAGYRRGEIFQYDMPDFHGKLVVPKLGFFTKEVSFPALYEGKLPWMSICPSEIHSMRAPIAEAFGRVLVLGLGLGYFPFHIIQKEEVISVTVVEKNPSVIELFRRGILPFFPRAAKEKLRLIEADAYSYLDGLAGGEYDFCFADLWEGAVDGASHYRALLPHASRLSSTRFRYWIEDAILAYLEDDSGD